MTSVGFETAIPANERPQTRALDFSKYTVEERQLAAPRDLSETY
jgi:hypothetical protein